MVGIIVQSDSADIYICLTDYINSWTRQECGQWKQVHFLSQPIAESRNLTLPKACHCNAANLQHVVCTVALARFLACRCLRQIHNVLHCLVLSYDAFSVSIPDYAACSHTRA
jgi:hypothetical protein